MSGGMENRPKLLPHGDRAVDIVFENRISPAINRRVIVLDAAIRSGAPEGIVNCIPAYRTLTVEYDPMRITYGQVCLFLRGIAMTADLPQQGRLLRIPVLYGGAYGPDLETVAAHAGLSVQETIQRHAEPEYHVYMIGFLPGFPYLGGLDPKLACPRKATPRLRVEGGSVGIAGLQTGIYPEASPGGWNLIGRTPIRLFDADTLSLLSAGDRVKFVPIDAETYRAICETGVWNA